ncbi:MAG: TrkH family potassium uptake protein [Clostridiales bacterium]|nr:TrkH family potassium uptake protein [Clostridiales bacterium]
MNYGSIRYILGWILKLEGLFMLPPVLVDLIYREGTWEDYLICGTVAFLLGTAMSFKKPQRTTFYAREGFITTALCWIVISLVGALPFYISGEIPVYTNAMFEIVSGFTTTGASILNDVEALSHANLFWRSFSHWIGGMGVLVFVMAILPLAGGGQNLHLMKAESPGPSVSKLVPKVRQTAGYLYGIYIALTLFELGLLLAGGMPLFDAVCTAFGTAGTGGFGIRNDSMGGYSYYIQTVVTVFMLLFGVNFSVYFLLLMRKGREALRISEVRCYFGIYAVITLLIAYNLSNSSAGVGENLHHAAFQAASIMTTTGFSTVDFDLWPEFSKVLLIVLMFIGACAGSTGGGIKVSRIVIYCKTVKKELDFLIHPRSIKAVQMDGKRIEHTVVRAANVFLVAYVGIYAVSLLLISLGNYDFTTNFTAVAATINNIGPGLSLVGPTGNFSMYSSMSKWVLIFDMLAGRLEIFPMLILLMPSTWRK